MKQSVKRIVFWHSILKGKLLNDSPLGKEYEVSDLGYVLVTQMDVNDASVAGSNPLCRISCYQEKNKTRRWTILGFGSFCWLEPSP